ncbi:hypothetical protein AC630_26020 [Bradyrhizobium sp. AS23.2]|nr:hypothetical protein AC630_26020 [Bradyrhizobium sp. AS23.2]
MSAYRKVPLFVFALSVGSLTAANAAQLPQDIAMPALATAAVLHAEGAQVYECRAASDGNLAWRAREPIATLIFEGSTVGRHYAGPRWEYADGSVVHAKLASSAPGATQDDIPWLRLDVVDQRGDGKLSGVTQVQRINTRGGVARGPCDEAGALRSVPYSADYVFLRKD